jgi:hypothetical protein
LRVEGSFQFTQDPDIDFADGAGQKSFLGQSNSVLATDRTAKLDGVRKDLCYSFVNPMDLVRVPLVG